MHEQLCITDATTAQTNEKATALDIKDTGLKALADDVAAKSSPSMPTKAVPGDIVHVTAAGGPAAAAPPGGTGAPDDDEGPPPLTRAEEFAFKGDGWAAQMIKLITGEEATAAQIALGPAIVESIPQ